MNTFIKNTDISFIEGYLNAISDLNTTDKGLIMRAFMKKDDSTRIEKSIKEVFDFINSVKSVKEKSFIHCVHLYHFLEIMILLNQCENNEDKKKNIISHLMDYIDFAFEKQGIHYKTSTNIFINLLQSDKENFIVLTIKKKDIEFYLCFFRYELNKQEIDDWFDEIIEYYEIKLKEYPPKIIPNDSDICENGLTVKVNREIIAPVIEEAIKLGYLKEKNKFTLLKYLHEDKVLEFEKSLFTTK